MRDIQKEADQRGVLIQEVGVSDVRVPLSVISKTGEVMSTVATMSMAVELPAEVKGTHMSRFLESLQEQGGTFNPEASSELAEIICRRLESTTCLVTYEFPYFITRKAPVSEKSSSVDYQVKVTIEIQNGCALPARYHLTVPIATLCPCSKEISQYGAHNQRGYVDLEFTLKEQQYLHFESLIDEIETCGSAPLINLLKRADEKFVTELAYDNPVFVEDVIRNVAVKLKNVSEIADYSIRVTNHESIHTHNAYAVVKAENKLN